MESSSSNSLDFEMTEVSQPKENATEILPVAEKKKRRRFSNSTEDDTGENLPLTGNGNALQRAKYTKMTEDVKERILARQRGVYAAECDRDVVQRTKITEYIEKNGIPKADNIFRCNHSTTQFLDLLENIDLESLLAVNLPECVKRVDDKVTKIIPSAVVAQTNNSFRPNLTFPIVKQKSYSTGVKTIGKIRTIFESDQSDKHRALLHKTERTISDLLKRHKKRLHCNWDEALKEILESGSPLTRATWKITSKFNKSPFKYRQQVCVVNGKQIVLAGSAGGDTCDVRLPTFTESTKKSPSKVTTLKTKSLPVVSKRQPIINIKKKGLLGSLNVAFKPGPLSKKPDLNDVDLSIPAKIELVKLPQVCLEVFPQIGVRLDPLACLRLGQVRQADGSMDEQWANFASSVVKQSDKPLSHTFVLPYENNQWRILMQKDTDSNSKYSRLGKEPYTKMDKAVDVEELQSELTFLDNYETSDDIEDSVKNVVSDMLMTVAISEIQDGVWQEDPNFKRKEEMSGDVNLKTLPPKPAKRKYKSELQRLDVTVIDYNEDGENESCLEEYCKLGCVCSTLKTSFMINEHCGSPECMLKCSCSFDMDTSDEVYKSDGNTEIPKLVVLNLQNVNNRYLAKEEKKFRRTVIRSKDQTIVMGACRRGARIPKKYEDFVFSEEIPPKDHFQSQQFTVSLQKLPQCLKLEPWCMVHQLYRCFCKNKFLEGSKYSLSHFDEPGEDVDVESFDFDFDNTDFCSRTAFHSKYIETLKMRSKKQISDDVSVIGRQPIILKRRYTKRKICDPVNNDVLIKSSVRLDKPSVIDLNVTNVTRSNSSEKEHSDDGAAAESLNNNNKEVSICTNSIVPALNELNKPFFLKPASNIFTLLDSHLANSQAIEQYGEIGKINLPSEGKLLLVTWNSFLSKYKKGQIHIFASKSKPWRFYVTHLPNIYGDISLMNIKEIVKFSDYPPIISYLFLNKVHVFKSVLLLGRKKSWEIIGVIKKVFSEQSSNNIVNDKNQHKPEKDIFFNSIKSIGSELVLLEYAVQNFTKETIVKDYRDNTNVMRRLKIISVGKKIKKTDLTKNSSVDNNFSSCHSATDQESSNIDSQPLKLWKLDKLSNSEARSIEDDILKTIPKKPDELCQSPIQYDEVECLTSEATPTKEMASSHKMALPLVDYAEFRWLLLTIGNDFDEIKVPSKNFSASNKDIIEAMADSDKYNRTIQLRNATAANDSSDNVCFGMYALPGYYKMKQIILGPYKKNEETGINVESVGQWTKKTAGCWLYCKTARPNQSASTFKISDISSENKDTSTSTSTNKITSTDISTIKTLQQLQLSKKKVSPNGPIVKSSILKGNLFLIRKIVKPTEKRNIKFKIVNLLNSSKEKIVEGAQKSLLKPLTCATPAGQPPKTSLIKSPFKIIKKIQIPKDHSLIKVANKPVNVVNKIASKTNNTVTNCSETLKQPDKVNKTVEDTGSDSDDDVIFMPEVKVVVEIEDSECEDD